MDQDLPQYIYRPENCNFGKQLHGQSSNFQSSKQWEVVWRCSITGDPSVQSVISPAMDPVEPQTGSILKHSICLLQFC